MDCDAVSSITLVRKFFFILVLIQFSSNHFRFYSIFIHLKSINFHFYLVVVLKNHIFCSYSVLILEILIVFVVFILLNEAFYFTIHTKHLKIITALGLLAMISKQTCFKDMLVIASLQWAGDMVTHIIYIALSAITQMTHYRVNPIHSIMTTEMKQKFALRSWNVAKQSSMTGSLFQALGAATKKALSLILQLLCSSMHAVWIESAENSL